MTRRTPIRHLRRVHAPRPSAAPDPKPIDYSAITKAVVVEERKSGEGGT